MRWFSWAWAALFTSGFLFEALVLALGIQGATLSEHLWFIRDRSPNIFGIIIFFLLWLIYHFAFQRRTL